MAKAVMQKDWYEIVAPELFDNEVVADTPAEDQSLVEGRTVKVNLKELMPSSNKYYMDVFLQVQDVEGSKAHAELVGHDTSKEYVSKMVSRRSNRLDYVEDIEMNDGKMVRVKIVATTIRKTKSAKIKALRKTIDDIVRDHAADNTFDEFMESIFQDELQQELKDATSEIYPLRDIEVRKTEVQ